MVSKESIKEWMRLFSDDIDERLGNLKRVFDYGKKKKNVVLNHMPQILVKV